MATNGYHSYRGRQSVMKRLLIVVLVLILLAACGFMLAQRYITYTDDGKLRLDLPFFQKEETPPSTVPEEPSENVNLVVDKPQEPGTEEPTVEQGSQYGERRIVELKNLPADAAALTETLSAQNANGFAYQVKDSSGLVRYSSGAAIQSAVDKNAVSGETLSALCDQEGVVSVARLSCFRDSYYAWTNMENAGICQATGYIWYDNNSWHWLDPAKEAARQYVIGLALECAQLGFDEILLEDVCYPFQGKLHKIDYSKNTLGKTEALTLFLTELQTALEPYDVKVDLLLNEKLFSAETALDFMEKSGQDLTKLLPLADAVYAPLGDSAAGTAALVAAAGEEGTTVFVPVTTAPGETGSWYFIGE